MFDENDLTDGYSGTRNGPEKALAHSTDALAPSSAVLEASQLLARSSRESVIADTLSVNATAASRTFSVIGYWAPRDLARRSRPAGKAGTFSIGVAFAINAGRGAREQRKRLTSCWSDATAF